MIVAVNMSKEVNDYFKGYNLDQVVDTLLDIYDFTTLPQISGKREVERKVNVSNELYINLYNTLGPRSKKVSLGRLLEFAYNMDVLRLPRFEDMRKSTVPNQHNPVPSLLNKAYRTLLDAQRYDNSEELKAITNLLYNYKEVMNGISE